MSIPHILHGEVDRATWPSPRGVWVGQRSSQAEAVTKAPSPPHLLGVLPSKTWSNQKVLGCPSLPPALHTSTRAGGPTWQTQTLKSGGVAFLVTSVRRQTRVWAQDPTGSHHRDAVHCLTRDMGTVWHWWPAGHFPT